MAEPTAFTGIASWTQISSGDEHGCGLAAGEAYCWGTVADGLLGDGSVTTRVRPTKLGDDHYLAVAGGPGASAIRSDGALIAWGYAPLDGVGFGDTAPQWAPARIALGG